MHLLLPQKRASGTGRRIGHFGKRQTRADPFGKVLINVEKVSDHRLAYVQMSDLGKLKHQGPSDVRLLMRSLAKIKLTRLAVVVRKALGTYTPLLTGFGCRGDMKAFHRRFTWRHRR